MITCVWLVVYFGVWYAHSVTIWSNCMFLWCLFKMKYATYKSNKNRILKLFELNHNKFSQVLIITNIIIMMIDYIVSKNDNIVGPLHNLFHALLLRHDRFYTVFCQRMYGLKFTTVIFVLDYAMNNIFYCLYKNP
jgi:hypothetical protein